MIAGTTGELRQAVGDLEPRRLRRDVEVREGSTLGIGVQDPEANAQGVGGIARAAVDRRAAARAERAELPRRRLVLADEVLAGRELPVLPPDVGVRRERGAARFPALR